MFLVFTKSLIMFYNINTNIMKAQNCHIHYQLLKRIIYNQKVVKHTFILFQNTMIVLFLR